MKKSLLILLGMLSCTGAQAATVPSRYLEDNITRNYYMDELEHCPGLLEMRPGDLWTITFPETIRDSFITREGVIDRQVVDNRLVMAAVGNTGSTPVLVMTTDSKAPRFRVDIKSGEGGRNKNVMVLPGLPPGGTQCPGAQISAVSRPGGPLTDAGMTASLPGAVFPKAEGRVRAAAPSYLQADLKRTGMNLQITLNNTLESDLALDGKDLRIGGMPTALDRFYLIPASSSLNITVPTAAYGEFQWPGVIIGSAEPFTITATLP